jgi:ABC-2 type transport system ATP-binding protein
MSDPMVSTHGLGKSIGGNTILRDITVDVGAGNVVGLIGKNGAGKSTFLDVLLGFSPATTGAATLFGDDSFSLGAATKRRIGFVPQQDELLDSLTGAQQLALNASLHRTWRHDLIARLVRDWEVPLDKRIQVLSGGERQKLSTLLALGHEPDLLVLDEPASSLDPVARRRFLREILEISESPARTVLFSTHIVADLERVANRLWIIRDGAIAWQGELDALKESVVRVTIHGRDALPACAGIPDLLSLRTEGTRAQAVVSHWRESRIAEMVRQFDAEVTVETLSLEEIFVELHS